LPEPLNGELLHHAVAKPFDLLVALPALERLDQREQLTNLLSQIRKPHRVAFDRGPLAFPHRFGVPRHENLKRDPRPEPLGIARDGKPVQTHFGRVVRVAHGRLSPRPGTTSRICRRRPRARMYRPLAACSDIPRTRAVSVLLSSSKCRSART